MFADDGVEDRVLGVAGLIRTMVPKILAHLAHSWQSPGPGPPESGAAAS